ncbi:MAG TPA: dienelactone hydrolase family protein [Vicinamibacterales bacterium]|nr:dienelactone hydrolase family protein [Vicinamibacterales bacterium]
MRRSIILLLIAFATTALVAQQPVSPKPGEGGNRIDTITPAAPELAPYGPHDIGVRTIQVTDKNRPDILNIKEAGPIVRYDRTLTLEVWYPATLAAGQRAGGEYRVITRDPAVMATLYGKAVRDAQVKSGARYPLVIISHGYPGNRFLMSHMGENLASKGFVAVSIDHKDSTYDDQKAFASTLYNRPFDQLFVLNEIDRLSKAGSNSFLAGLVDASRAGIIGYSMGGYGVVNVIGGGYTAESAAGGQAPPNKMLLERGAANPDYQKARDPRIKAAIAIAPWGMQGGYWDAEGLKGIRTPVMFVGGSADDVAGYEKGTRAIYQGAVNADRYLLTFINANHNAAAPIPAPAEMYASAGADRANPFTHYADAVWDTARMNNIFDHFATAFFSLHLKDEKSMQAYLDVVPNGKDAVYAIDRDGKPMPSHNYWKGFKRATAVGLVLEHATPVQ